MSAELRPLRGLPLPALVRLAERVFGRGDRPPGWLARKLEREAVDPDLSLLALAPGPPGPVSDARLLGYVLVGREPDDPVARSAGVGVVLERRGLGLGRALVEGAAEGLARAGLCTLRVLAEPAREPFYAALGLRVHARHVTLLAAGTSAISAEDHARELARSPPRTWHPAPTSELVEICAWRPGTWARTPGPDAATLELPLAGAHAWAHVSREGRALLVHRLLVPRELDPLDALRELLARTPAATPLVLYGCDPVSSITARAQVLGFAPAQHFAAMDLQLLPLLDKPRSAGA